MAGWIEDQGDGADAVRQVEGESRHDGPPQFLRLPAEERNRGLQAIAVAFHIVAV